MNTCAHAYMSTCLYACVHMHTHPIMTSDVDRCRQREPPFNLLKPFHEIKMYIYSSFTFCIQINNSKRKF